MARRQPKIQNSNRLSGDLKVEIRVKRSLGGNHTFFSFGIE